MVPYGCKVPGHAVLTKTVTSQWYYCVIERGTQIHSGKLIISASCIRGHSHLGN